MWKTRVNKSLSPGTLNLDGLFWDSLMWDGLRLDSF